jgi:hypothetical protein
VAEQFLQNGAVGKRRSACQHEKQRAPKRIKVAAHVRAPRVLRLLWRDVVECPQRHASGRQLSVGRSYLVHPSQSHIDQLQLSIAGDQHVRWLDIAMHHRPLMGMFQGLRQLHREIDRFFECQRPTSLHVITYIRAFDILEDNEVQASVFPDVVDTGDVRVI